MIKVNSQDKKGPLRLSCIIPRSLNVPDAAIKLLNSLRPRQNGRQFPDDIFKWILLTEHVIISIKISLMFVHKGSINNIPTLVQIMTWRRPGDKPLSEPMMVRLSTHICVTRPQWVNGFSIDIPITPWISFTTDDCYSSVRWFDDLFSNRLFHSARFVNVVLVIQRGDILPCHISMYILHCIR